MPWQEMSSMDQRLQFITDHQRNLYAMAELCARHGISRKTGYKWLTRYEREGVHGLAERTHAPHVCPHRIGDELATLLLDARRAHPSWGPAKLVQFLTPRHPGVDRWPAISTVADLLKRHALVRPRRLRRPIVHPGTVPMQTRAPNDLWTADFKGQFRTRDGIYCFPLTIADQHTRYLLRVHGLLNTRGVGVRPVFERAFREYGLPRAIRTDNGVPFANTGLHGLTQLNVWWLRLGIQHQRIRPAAPQENGAHERMHRTLKAETTRPRRPISRSSNGRSPRFDASTTRCVRTPRSGVSHRRRATRPRLMRTRRRCRRSSIRATSSSNASPTQGPFAFRIGCSSSPMHSSSTTSGSRRATMASGRSISAPCCSGKSMRQR